MADVTKMVMKVDLQCSKCYKKIKKVLRCIPQIRDQVYDEKQNKVTITVVCCSPEKIKEKIVCKARDTVESIEIVKKVRFVEPPKEDAPVPPSRTLEQAPIDKKPKVTLSEPRKEDAPGPPSRTLERAPIQPSAPPLPIVQGFPMYPVGVCCCCYAGPMRYDGCGRPVYMCSGANRGCCVSRCYEYFSEENAWGCSVM